MSTITKDRPVDKSSDSDEGDELVHLYMLPQGSSPMVGDKALCGWIKQNPAVFSGGVFPPGWPRCVVCQDLKPS